MTFPEQLRAWVDKMPSRDQVSAEEYATVLMIAADAERIASNIEKLERKAPTSLATEGRVLPYMGRHRLEQETNAGR